MIKDPVLAYEQALMKGKKNKNIMKDDLFDINRDESDEEENKINRKKKTSEKENKKNNLKTMIDSHGKKTSHYVKYSGEEYKSNVKMIDRYKNNVQTEIILKDEIQTLDNTIDKVNSKISSRIIFTFI